MTDYGLTLTGFTPMPADVVESQVIASLRGIEELESLTAGDEEAFAKWAAIHAEREALLWELGLLLWQSGSRENSTGASLDNNLSLIGNSRLEEAHSTVAVTLYNRTSSTPVTVPVDHQIRQSTTGVIWELLEEAEIPGNADLYTGLNVGDIEWQSSTGWTRINLPSNDYSIVAVGDEITLSGCTNASNDGTFPIMAVNDTSNYVDILNTARTDGTDDETGSPGTADINDSITVLAQSLSAGAYEASIGSIDEIVNPLSGLDGVINLAAALVGRSQETDAAAKRRAAIELANATGGTLEAVKQAVEAVDGVIYVSAEQNTSNVAVGDLAPNSIHLTVVGGTDQAIVDAIGLHRADGIATNGAEFGAYTDSTGNAEIIYFSRVTEVNPYLIVNLSTNASYPADGDDLVKAALEAMTWAHGGDLINYLLVVAIGNAGIDGILTIEVLQGLSPTPTLSTNISIPSTEVINITADRITVNS